MIAGVAPTHTWIGKVQFQDKPHDLEQTQISFDGATWFDSFRRMTPDSRFLAHQKTNPSIAMIKDTAWHTVETFMMRDHVKEGRKYLIYVQADLKKIDPHIVMEVRVKIRNHADLTRYLHAETSTAKDMDYSTLILWDHPVGWGSTSAVLVELEARAMQRGSGITSEGVDMFAIQIT